MLKMKDEIKAGDYIRTANGTIAQIEDVEFELTYHLISSELLYRHWIDIDDCRLEIIKKHSSNIIDLIEEGDILKVKDRKLVFYVGIEKDDGELTHQSIIDAIKNKEVELLSIVTKEQFKNVQYKV